MYEQNVLLRSYKSFKHTFNHALLESKISGTISFVQWWVLDLDLIEACSVEPGCGIFGTQ